MMTALVVLSVLIGIGLGAAPYVVQRAVDRGESVLEFLLFKAKSVWVWLVVKRIVNSQHHVQGDASESGDREQPTDCF